MNNTKYFRRNLLNHLEKFIDKFCDTLKISFFVFIPTFVISSIYLLYESLKSDSIRTYFAYLRAKFYVGIGFRNLDINVYDLNGNSAELNITDVVTNIHIIKNYLYVKYDVLGSIKGGFSAAIFMVAILLSFFALRSLVKIAIRKKLISKFTITINRVFFDIPAPTEETPFKHQESTKINAPTTISQHDKLEELKNATPLTPNLPAKTSERVITTTRPPQSATKEANNSSQIVRTELGTYQIIPDNKLPYPMLKRVIFIESEKTLNALKPEQIVTIELATEQNSKSKKKSKTKTKKLKEDHTEKPKSPTKKHPKKTVKNNNDDEDDDEPIDHFK